MFKSTFVVSIQPETAGRVVGVNVNRNRNRNRNRNSEYGAYAAGGGGGGGGGSLVFVLTPFAKCSGSMEDCLSPGARLNVKVAASRRYADYEPVRTGRYDGATAGLYDDDDNGDGYHGVDSGIRFADGFRLGQTSSQQSKNHETVREASPDGRPRQRPSPKVSLPSGRLYDWNTTHFFPDQHEVSVGLTFEAPYDKRSVDAGRYFADESRMSGNPTFISVSKEEPSERATRPAGISAARPTPSGFGSGFASGPTASSAMPVQERVSSLSGDEESFEKVWQRSPVRRKSSKKDARPEARSDALPPKASPHSVKKGRTPPNKGDAAQPVRGFVSPAFGTESRPSAARAGNSTPTSWSFKMPEIADLRGPRYRSEQHIGDVAKRSELALDRSGSSTERGRDRGEPDDRGTRVTRPRAIQTSTANHHQHHHQQHQNQYRDQCSHKSGMTSPPLSLDSTTGYRYETDRPRPPHHRPFGSNTLDSAGSHDSPTRGSRVCAEEDKLRWLGYEIDQYGSDSIGSVAPEDDYVYVLKKVHRRPASAVDRTGRRESYDHEKQVKVATGVEHIPPEQRYAARLTDGPSLPLAGVRGAAERCRDWNAFQRDLMVERAAGNLRDWNGEFVDRGHRMERNLDIPPRSDYAASPPMEPIVGNAINRALQPTYGSWSNSRSDSWKKHGSYERGGGGGGGGFDAPTSDYGSTVFGVTGFRDRKPPSGSTDGDNRSRPSEKPRVSDLRRRPVSSWLELGNDLEQSLRLGCYGDSSDASGFGGSVVDRVADSYCGEARSFAYPEEGESCFRESEDRSLWDEESRDAVGLIFDAIDRQDRYSSQSDVMRRSSVAEAIYSKPQKKPRRHKTQDRFEDLIFLDLHGKPRFDSGAGHQEAARRPTRPSSFAQPLRAPAEPAPRQSRGAAPSIRSAAKFSCSLPGSRENLRRDSSSDDADGGCGQFTVAEIKAKLFGPNEEKAKSLLQRGGGQSAARSRFASQDRLNNYHRSFNARPSDPRIDEYPTGDGRSGYSTRSYFDHPAEICYSPSSSSNSEERVYNIDNIGRKLHLQEVPSDSISSLARRDLDDMASRRYKISNRWSARSTPDLSQRESRGNSRIQTSYPRRSSRTVSKERLSKPLQTIRERESNVQVSTSESSPYKADDFAAPAPKGHLARRQSLCTGVAKLVDLFEKSISAPNLLEENLFANAYSTTGDLIFDGDEVDAVQRDADFVRASTSDQSKQSGNRYKRSKKAKIRLLKSSDSGYIESETDSICSSGKDKTRASVESNAEETTGERATAEAQKYDRERRSRDIRQLREEWLNASPSQSPSNFISKVVLPLDTKQETSVRHGSRLETSSRTPYYERTCTVTSFGQSTQSAFAKISKPPQPKQSKKAETGREPSETKRVVGGKETKGMSALTERGAVSIPVVSIAEPILASKFPSGQVPHSVARDQMALDSRRSFLSRQGLERFELSDDGSQTDCTDGTIDAILASNQLATLSPTSTLDCSDFEFYQAASSFHLPPSGGSKGRGDYGAQKDGARPERTDAKPPRKAQLRKSMSDASDSVSRESEQRSIRDLVDSFELLLSNPFAASKSTIST